MPWWDLRSLSGFRNSRAIFQDEISQRLQISAYSNAIEFPLIEHWNERTMEVRCTVKSHGFIVAKTHLYDWLIFLVLGVLDIILNVIPPFYRYVGKDMMNDLKYPFKSNTIPVWSVPVYAGLLPIVVFVIIYYRRRDVYDLHHAILGLLYSCLVTLVLTDSIKIAVGWPRPNFFLRCFPDGIDVYDQLGNVVCHGEKHVVDEGHKSFPSGHTSFSFAGMVFLSLYISGKIQAFDRGGHVAKLCLVFLPLLVASLVGISRVDDYWHHWQDVFAGSLLGSVVAIFCYLQFFPPPYNAEGWGPYAYFRMLKDTMQTEIGNEQVDRRNNGFMEVQSAYNSSSPLNDVELGRRH